MTTLIRKRRGDPLAKGCWFLNQHADVKICCPNCGGVGDLNGHEIMPLPGGQALVSPSVQCECGFHGEVALLAWDDDGPVGSG